MSPGQKGDDLGLQRGETACLNLDQEVPSDQVDDEGVDRYFDLVSGEGVPLLQGGMEWLFPQRPDV
jgi:hypothetical protein